MTLTQLRTFLLVADRGSVRAAAEVLFVSQPAVSGALSALERDLGVDLVKRDGRGLRISPAGQAFAASVRASLNHLDRGARVARSVDEPGKGAVRIAAIATVAERLLLPLLGRFHTEHPDAEITMRVGNRSTVWAALDDLDVDLVVAGRPPPSIGGDVLGRATNTLVVVGPPAAVANLRTRRTVLAHLALTAWMLREDGSGTRDATDELLVRLGLDPPKMVLGSNGAVEAAVVAGLGVALLPLSAVGPRLDAGAVALIDCPGTPIERPWHLVASAAVELSPTAVLAARSLLDAPGAFNSTPEGRRLLS